ncbi:MAG: cyclic peptide export ABC transporter, partial [Gemmatimonadota bacterium]
SRLLDRIQAANLRVVENVGVMPLHYHLLVSIGQLSKAYGALLTFATSLVMLCCNLVYLGWLSPLGFGAAAVVIVVGVAVHFYQERVNLPRRLRLDELERGVHGRYHETLSGYKELRLSDARTADYRGRMDRDNETVVAEGLRVTRTSTLGEIASRFFQFLLVFLLIFALPLFSSVEAVVILQMMTAVFVTMGPLTGVVDGIPAFTRARVALGAMRMLQREIFESREPPEPASGAALPPFESIELKGICFDFEDQDAERFRLGPVDLSVRRGEVLFVIGGNGSGKSVLMRVLTGLYHHRAGEIRYNGCALTSGQRQAYREQFAAVFGDFHLFREWLGAPPDPIRVQYWLERLDLADKTRYANGQFASVTLSAGQRRRLALLVALLEDRPILVLDEFGAEQDPAHKRMFYRELIPEMKARGATLVVVTHDDTYFGVADRVLKMEFGRVVSPEGRSASEQLSGLGSVLPIVPD